MRFLAIGAVAGVFFWAGLRYADRFFEPGPAGLSRLPLSHTAVAPSPSSFSHFVSATSQRLQAPQVRSRPQSDTPIASSQPHGHEPPEGSGLIEFQVINGLAIAYGDLILGEPEPGSNIKKGHYEAPAPRLWERPEIPYAISTSLPRPERVKQAIEYFHKHTPISFVPYQGQPDAIVFEPGEEHCYSYLGRIGGAQPIRLSTACQAPQIIHELMHALGFIHQQSRRDRDQYVEVLWENIEESFRGQFAMVPDSFMEAEGDSPFDYRSAMIYSPDSFALRPGAPTLRSLNPAEGIQPARDGLSEGDIQKLKRLYRL